MDQKQREAVFAFFLCFMFITAAIFLNLFRLGESPAYSFLALLSSAVLGYLISLKCKDINLKLLHAALIVLLALFVASLKTGLGVMIVPTAAIPVSAVLLLSLLGPQLRSSIFRKDQKKKEGQPVQ